MEFRDPFARSAAAQSGAQATTYDAGLRAYFLRIYNLMGSALALTGIVALIAANSPAFQSMLYTENGLSGFGWLIALAPLGMVMWLSFGMQRMSATAMQAVFWAYAALVGLSLSSIFIVYTGESIARAFFVTAATFGAMSLYGYTTKKDLSGWGSFLMMGVIGLVIAMIVNIFLQSSALQFAISAIAILVFVGLTAYDTQRLKHIYYQLAGSSQMLAKATIMGALSLYLDFINIFIHLLHFMGDRR